MGVGDGRPGSFYEPMFAPGIRKLPAACRPSHWTGEYPR